MTLQELLDRLKEIEATGRLDKDKEVEGYDGHTSWTIDSVDLEDDGSVTVNIK
jgi:hypothetical protein